MRMFERIKIVLVGTSHPGNIGSAARAMKTMGLEQLVLVSPNKFPHQQAIEMASGAFDILEQAIVVDSLEEAIADTHLVIGSSARPRGIQLPMLEMEALGSTIAEQAELSQCAIVFGRERTGLTNQELGCCHFHTMIPTNPDYSSLNLAQAVQIFCYELRRTLASNEESIRTTSTKPIKLAQTSDVEGFYQHLENTLFLTDFLDRAQPNKVMPKLRKLFNRIHLEEAEVNILRGILSSVKYAVQGKD